MNWISVDDKLPAHDQRVICVQSPIKTATKDPLFGIYDAFLERFADPTYTPDGVHKGLAYWIEITHWMPLPEPPKPIKE